MANDLTTLFLIIGAFIFFIKYSLVGIAISLVVAIITVIICAVKKVFKRKNKFWNFFTILYYPLIIIVFLLQGFVIGTLYGTKELIKHEITSENNEYLNSSFLNIARGFKNYLVEEVDTNKIDSYSIVTLSREFLTKDNENQASGRIIGESILYNYFNGIIYCFIDYHKMNEVDKFMDKNDVEIFLSLDLEELDIEAEKTIQSCLEKLTASFLKEILLKLVLYLSLILILPILDTIVYYTFYRKSQLL